MNYSSLFNRDYKSKAPAGRKRVRPHPLSVLAIAGLSAGLVTLMTVSDDAEATRLNTQTVSDPSLPLQEIALTLPALSSGQTEVDAASAASLSEVDTGPVIDWQEERVKDGDTLSAIFERMELPYRELMAILAEKGEAERLTHIRPGQTLRFHIEDGRLQHLEYPIDEATKLLVSRTDDGFHTEQVAKPVDVRLAYSSGTITDSLFLAGRESGLSDNLIMELAGIFGWDVDFALDIRDGDSFSILYEERYLDGEYLGNGDIIAAEFVNQGREVRAVRFVDDKGEANYFTPDGYSMRKAFLRSPVDFRRISSTFQRERYHPVLGVKRPHRGVDYAAATGTPIRAAGDGRVIFRGSKGGYGNTVIIQHGASYTTLYGHMSKFQRGVTNGTRVRQGQVIGYVGMTGTATGPHLHYEFRIDGVHRNPLTIKLPDAEPIDESQRQAFEAQTAPLLAQLDTYQRTQLAMDH